MGGAGVVCAAGVVAAVVGAVVVGAGVVGAVVVCAAVVCAASRRVKLCACCCSSCYEHAWSGGVR